MGTRSGSKSRSSEKNTTHTIAHDLAFVGVLVTIFIVGLGLIIAGFN